MAFDDNRKFWKEFIELYREHSCLWDVNSTDYSKRNVRNRAYNALVLKCKKKYPDANKYFVAKKINSLRTSFRRQFRKLQDSTGDSVEPTLWYFHLLLFTLDQDELRAGIHPSVYEDLGDEDMSINETDSQPEYNAIDSRDDHDEVAHPYSPQPPEQDLGPVQKKRKRLSEPINWTDPNRKDSCSLYGEFVADSIRNLKNKRLQSWIRHQINNVLYAAEQNYYQNPSLYPNTESLKFSIDTSTLPKSQNEGESKATEHNVKSKHYTPAPSTSATSTSPSRVNTSSKSLEVYIKEEPLVFHPSSPTYRSSPPYPKSQFWD